MFLESGEAKNGTLRPFRSRRSPSPTGSWTVGFWNLRPTPICAICGSDSRGRLIVEPKNTRPLSDRVLPVMPLLRGRRCRLPRTPAWSSPALQRQHRHRPQVEGPQRLSRSVAPPPHPCHHSQCRSGIAGRRTAVFDLGPAAASQLRCRVRACDEFERARAARQNVFDLGAIGIGATVAGRAPTTPPGMRVRTGRFEKLRSRDFWDSQAIPCSPQKQD